jgi:hypothetical protein
MDFVVKGVMIGGFALVAAPAVYNVTGVRSFIVSHDGVVYEKDLGPRTLDEFKKMERHNPDKTWTATWMSTNRRLRSDVRRARQNSGAKHEAPKRITRN